MMLGSASSPEQQFIDREEEQERLERINRRLSLFERKVLKLYLDGYSYQEIGVRLNKSAKSVDNAVQRIRRKVEAYYGGFSES